jgi:hypothetical protein
VHISVATSPGFSIVANPSTLSVAQGAQGSAMLTLFPSGGYAASVTLACSGLPTNATCTFSPATVTLDGKDTVESTSLTITTQGSASAIVDWRSPMAEPHSLPAILFALAALLILMCYTLSCRRKALYGFLAIALFSVIVVSAGCGSGGSNQTSPPPPPPPTPTPTGETIVTVTATATNSSSSTAVLLDVTP